MSRNNLERDSVTELRKALQECFPLYRPEHSIRSSRMDDAGRRIYVGYGMRNHTGSTKWLAPAGLDINLIDGVCYLLFIHLDPEHRGKGLGWKLYEAVHEFARAMGCSAVRQTPSGGYMRNGKRVQERLDYLLKRGYVPFGDNEVELRLQTSAAEAP